MYSGVTVQPGDRGTRPRHPELRRLLERVRDPEIPVLSIVDLGIVRDARVDEGMATVVITPTYSGCPAMVEIRRDIRAALEAAGFRSVRVETVLHPAWSSDWLTDKARESLRRYGIAPPPPPGTARHPDSTAGAAKGDSTAAGAHPATAVARECRDSTAGAECPRCGSAKTRVISDFGSTACKALHKCRACLEPFESFKCI